MSIITSNFRQIISVMKTKTLVFPEKWYFRNNSFWHFNSCFGTHDLSTTTFILGYWEKTWTENEQLGRITTLINLHQFHLTRDSKHGLVGTDRNAILQNFASIWLYLDFLFIMSIIRRNNWYHIIWRSRRNQL